MRAIKFRGKMVDGGQWIVGSLLTWPDGEKYILYDEDFADSGMMNKESVFSKTVGQFTGLKDKNGKEIYEGDVVQNGEGGFFYVIEWWEEDAAFRGKQVGSSSTIGLNFWRQELHIVGNIHDNPELLEAK